MRKFFKIFGITLGTLLLVLLIAIVVVINFVFTPNRITPVINKYAEEYITDSCEIGKVELTFFSTFPEFGLRVEDLRIDEWLSVNELVATVDVRKFLKENALDIHCLRLTDADITLIQDTAGNWNFNVFAFTSDSTEEDTTAFSLPFEDLTIGEIDLNLRSAVVLMQPDSIFAEVHKARLQAAARSWNDIDLSLEGQSVTAIIGEEIYAQSLPLSLKTEHAALDLEAMQVVLQETQLQVADYALSLAGEVNAKDDLLVDLQLVATDWQIVPLLELLPASITSSLDGIDITNGSISLTANARGTVSSDHLPLIDATLQLKDGAGAYKAVLPYDLRKIGLQATAQLNLNDDKQNAVQIQQLTASIPTGLTVSAKGNITELLADMNCQLHLSAKGQLQELQPILKDLELPLTGNANLNLQADLRARLSDLTNYDLPRADLRGSLTLNELDIDYDSILVRSSQAALSFHMPYSKSPVLALTADMQAADLEVVMDSMSGTLQQPTLSAQIEYDTKDTTRIPVLKATLGFNDLQAYYTDIQAHLTQSRLSASLQGGRRDKTQPRLEASLETAAMQAHVGSDIAVKTDHFALTAKARYKPNEENILLQWNPRLSINLTNGEARLADFAEVIHIPNIDFDYSNRKCDIRQSQILLGNSDFSLVGHVENIGKWLRKKDILTGELTFSSQHTDVNELMTLCSAKETSPDPSKGGEASSATLDTPPLEGQGEVKEDSPFLVPTDVDLTLNTHINEAVVFDQIARELGGKVYVRNGVLVLEEMGFICRAARLQLTAMYKTPRKNHLYLGLDYHMLDVKIDELVNLIPQIDTMLPMLRSFRGDAEFHLAAETYLNSKYELKTSTTRGACAITGKDLVLLDNETFGKIAKILMFNKKTENLVDSINAEITLYKNEIDVYPFCVSLDNYMVAVGGRHNLDMSFDYDINVLSPIYLGAHVGGTFDDLDIKLAKCKYAQDFKPLFRREVDTQNANLKKMILESMQKNVKQ